SAQPAPRGPRDLAPGGGPSRIEAVRRPRIDLRRQRAAAVLRQRQTAAGAPAPPSRPAPSSVRPAVRKADDADPVAANTGQPAPALPARQPVSRLQFGRNVLATGADVMRVAGHRSAA